MNFSRAIYGIIAILVIVIAAVVDANSDFGDSREFLRIRSPPSAPSACKGSIADCIAEEENMEFDSDISQRILAHKKYASYHAMRKNNVPASKRGASYYDGAQAKPYTRGCNTITRCTR